MLQKVDAAWRKFGDLLATVGAIILILLTLLVVLDVSLRYFFNKPIAGAAESTELFLPWIIFSSFAYTLARGGHVRVSLLLSRFPFQLRLWAESLACVIGVAFCGLLAYFGWLHFWESFLVREFMMATVKLPWYIGKLSMPVGLFVISLQFLFLLLLNLPYLRTKGKS